MQCLEKGEFSFSNRAKNNFPLLIGGFAGTPLYRDHVVEKQLFPTAYHSQERCLFLAHLRPRGLIDIKHLMSDLETKAVTVQIE